jgi:hypothetical protein
VNHPRPPGKSAPRVEPGSANCNSVRSKEPRHPIVVLTVWLGQTLL